ncbi:cdc42 effector protein 1 [Chanos chanos]|uniref:Cdc42 effector protein 1 n=1 Tax=Chanos chanos TaxID=29144 RepID=A0A6J2VHM8_CHACN|nr:cdc42 effector protein 1-like [Chanos chanos]
MNLGKLSGLKGLVSHSQGRRRFKGDLTAEMISPPLGDFRHTMHVGRGGDVFGDTSFLSNHGGAGSNGDGDTASTPDKSEGFFTRTLRHVRKTPDRPRGGSKDLSPPPPPISPIIKNAISLPRLNTDSPNGCPVKVLFPSSPKPPEDSTYSYGVESGFVTLPRLSRSERQPQESSAYSSQIHRGSLTDTGVFSLTCSDSVTRSDSASRSDSMNSFTVDLGPSLMSEVFALIDSPTDDQEDKRLFGTEHEPESTFGLPGHTTEMDSGTTSLVDSLLREDYNGRKGLYGAGWRNAEVACDESPKRTATDVPKRSVIAEEQRLEEGKFQRAADVLARHYGSKRPDAASSKAHCVYPDEEEEIKV